MTDDLIALGETFREQANIWDRLTGADANDERLEQTDALGDTIEAIARRMADTPAIDLAGMRTKAAAFAHYAGVDVWGNSVADALLRSLLADLLRGTTEARWLAVDPMH